MRIAPIQAEYQNINVTDKAGTKHNLRPGMIIEVNKSTSLGTSGSGTSPARKFSQEHFIVVAQDQNKEDLFVSPIQRLKVNTSKLQVLPAIASNNI